MSSDFRDDPTWRQIDAFRFDDGATALPFAARLARENGWHPRFARRVLQEYRRFVYLCLRGDGLMVPSAAVDQAWHLHLTCSRSYWERFCAQTLGRPLHHEPTRGGAGEARRYRAGYEQTLVRYREVFGEDPPADCWPPAHERFDPNGLGVWVPVARYWLIPRPRWLPRFRARGDRAALFLLLAGTTLLAGCLGPWIGDTGPFRLHGDAFLAFFWQYSLVVILFAWVLRRWLCHPGGRPAIDDADPYLVATLQHDEYMAANAAIARLVCQETLEIDDEYRLRRRAPLPSGAHPLEQAVYASVPDGNGMSDSISVRVGATGQQGGALLQRALRHRFLLDAPRAARARWMPLVAFLSIPLIGLLKLDVGIWRERPIGWLIASLVVLTLVGLVMFARRPRRTRRGDRWLRMLKRAHRSLKDGDFTDAPRQVAMAVALFGPQVLYASGLTTLAGAMTPPPGSPSSGCSGGCSSGCSGDGGGDSGCGSGCGGCGGD